MKAIIQRVKEAILKVDDQLICEINQGLVVYLGIGKEDTDDDLMKLAKKTSGLRIFSDQQGKMNLSVKDINGEIMVVSQFTLFGELTSGYRPSFSNAAPPADAEKMYLKFYEQLKTFGVKKVVHGVFGADMQIKQHNDGPVTIIMDTKLKK